MHRKPFLKLTPREQTRKADDLASTLLAACICRTKGHTTDMQEMKDNKEVALASMNLTDEVKNRVQKELKVNLDSLKNQPTPRTEDNQKKFKKIQI